MDMPIRTLLQGNQAFGPGDIVPMVAAFEDALSVLRLTNRQDPATLMIARKIIELATQGERDPIRLRDGAIKSLSK